MHITIIQSRLQFQGGMALKDVSDFKQLKKLENITLMKTIKNMARQSDRKSPYIWRLLLEYFTLLLLTSQINLKLPR